jgi:hypothetical protein
MRATRIFLLAALLLGPGPAAGFETYTLAQDFPFEVTIPGNGSVVRGTFHAASPAEIDSWDLTTSGQDANAPPGTHACADLSFNPFASCPFFIEGPGDQADAVVFRLSLDGESGPVSQTGPVFSPLVDTPFGEGSAYIISADPAERVPAGSAGASFQFQNFSAPRDPQFFLQAGESTVWLLSRYEPGAIAAALAEGATAWMSVADNSSLGIGDALTGEVGLTQVPEPGALVSRLLASCALLFLARRGLPLRPPYRGELDSRRRRRPDGGCRQYGHGDHPCAV